MLDTGRIDLELQIVGGDPIHGRLARPGGPAREFRGWLGLAAAIEELAQPVLDAPPTSTPLPEA